MQTCKNCGAEMNHYPADRELCDPCDREDYLANLAGDRL